MKRFLLVSAAVGVLTITPNAFASTAHTSAGTVVSLTRGGVLVAGGNGTVTFVAAHARVGARVLILGSSLRVVGISHSARVRGIVAARRGQLLVLSAAHRLFPLHMRGRVPAGVSSGAGPRPGEIVSAAVSIDSQGNLVATSTEDDGQAQTVQIQATITAVGTNTITLSVNGQSIALPLPAGTTVPTTAVGTQVGLTLTFAAGTTTANEDEQGDDDQGEQGDDDNQGTTTNDNGHDQGDGGGDD
jgi:hypothetical protein